MDFSELEHLLDSNLISYIEFTDDGYKVTISKQINKLCYDITIICSDDIKLECDIMISIPLVRYKVLFASVKHMFSHLAYNITTRCVTPTELSLHLDRLNNISTIIAEMKEQNKIKYIDTVNKLISDHGYNFSISTKKDNYISTGSLRYRIE